MEASHRKFFAIFMALAAVFSVGHHASAGAAQAHYHVVGTGDSILNFVRPYINGPDRWFDTEQGRNAYEVGTQGRDSTVSVWPDVLRASEPGGWVVIQDNGFHVTDDAWRNVMRMIVDQLPDNRCLLGILPVYLPSVNAEYAAFVAAKATIMAQEFSQQPCHQFIYWNRAVLVNSNLVYDGQHPSVAGRSWLGRAINSVVD